MEQSTRNEIQKATQAARRLLEEEYHQQLEGTYDILLEGRVGDGPGAHLDEEGRVVWHKLVDAVGHKQAQGRSPAEAVADYLREAAFHTLNRFVALKMLEARELVQECVSQSENSKGFGEYTKLAPGLIGLPDGGFRLYIESIFDEIGQEVRTLFDRRDPYTQLWPRRPALVELLGILNAHELLAVWGEDETIGWVYQYFNSDDERKQMRAKSHAPRNSRELAVRNQFFTPRYVVQFLTDNTLGRLWREMAGSDTQLADLEYFVRGQKLVERPLKDPRDLRILDPACGSGHFLLYAFDLLAGAPGRLRGVYEEAWERTDTPVSEVTNRRLSEDYETLEALRRAVPELVLRHNLHGVDIDPRAAQIAALALWMRAQRAFGEHKVPAAERPAITRTNIVIAEPMPGDKAMVAEFAEALRPRVLGDLFQRMVEEMKLAGELGALLRIEVAMGRAVAKARKQFREETRERPTLPGFDGLVTAGDFDLADVSEEGFFDSTEEVLLTALERYSASAVGTATIRRRLFADDAVQGIAFIDIFRKHFDLVLMNPPFGEATEGSRDSLAVEYPDWNRNLLCAFVARSLELVGSDGYAGAIIDKTALIKSSYEPFRREFIWGGRGRAYLAVDLGWEVLDANVETGAIALTSRDLHNLAVMSCAGHEASQRGDALRQGAYSEFQVLDAEGAAALPNLSMPFSLERWVIQLLGRNSNFEQVVGRALAGHSLKSDINFRLFWELPLGALVGTGCYWTTLYNGGKFVRYSSPLRDVTRYGSKGSAVPPHISTRWCNLDCQQDPGVGWGKRGDFIDAHIMPTGSVFTVEGQGLPLANEERRWLALALINSASFWYLMSLFAGQHKYSGYVNKCPVPIAGEELVCALVELAKEAHGKVTSAYALDETTLFFEGPRSPPEDASLEEWWSTYREQLSQTADALEDASARIESLVQEWLGVDENGRDSVRTFTKAAPTWRDFVSQQPYWEYNSFAMAIVSYLIGAAFGRFGKAAEETLKADSPFEQLPRHSPAAQALPGSPLRIAVSDEGAADDLSEKVREAGILFWGPGAEEVLASLGTRAGGSQGSLCRLIALQFFDYHVSMYSQSNRRAPIYWQLATPSASYSVWLYIHSFQRDTLYRVLYDHVRPKIADEKEKLDRLSESGGASGPTDRMEVDRQEILLSELLAFRDEVARVAPLWNPNLDDGVIINFAPLWRLVPHHRGWQEECRKHWEKLVESDYDWAHLAMHLWPERVVPKCAEDRSLAIAHGLEEVFWREDSDGKWHPREVDQAEVERLIEERSSAAVKAALEDLLSAPAPAGGSGRSSKARRSRPTSPRPRASASTSRTPKVFSSAARTSSGAEPDAATLDAVQQAIAAVEGGAGKSDVIAATGLSDGEWNAAIGSLLQAGRVRRTGKKRGTRYHVA